MEQQPQQPYGQPQQPYGQPQQPYGQPQYTPPPPGYAPPPPGYSAQPGYAPQQQSAPNRWGPSSIGLDANIAAGLGYLIPIIGLIFFFIEKTNRFVKFNAAQSILIGIASLAIFVVQIVVDIIGAAADAATNGSGIGILFTLFGCLFGLLYLVTFAAWIWGMVIGFTGRYVKMPVIGNIAEQWAGGPAVPAF